MRVGRAVTALGLACAFAGGCSTDGGGGKNENPSPSADEAVTDGDVAAWAGAYCTRARKCAPPGEPLKTQEECTAYYADDHRGVIGMYRRDIYVAAIPCYRDTACDKTNDYCIPDAAESFGLHLQDADIAKSPEVLACAQKRDECKGAGIEFTDEICVLQLLLVTSKHEAVQRCLAGGGAGIRDCLDPYLELPKPG